MAVLHSKGWKLRKIAVKLGRNIGTLSRELKR
ncbi:MAG: helix-turn-helix domain-containing protein, partial [Elusimicrobia bacterium]|nr:helix-turn-helix domain-containing protein [Elusimicrobiota bacterium]